MILNISCKSISKRRNTVQNITYNYDTPMHTIKDLIIETVRINLTEYKKRQESLELLKVLSKENIENQELTGKISFNKTNAERVPVLSDAIQTALECFEDGLVVIFIDGKQIEHLQDAISLHDGSEITFVKMTMLCGRMW